jgi:hypothetical protein
VPFEDLGTWGQIFVSMWQHLLQPLLMVVCYLEKVIQNMTCASIRECHGFVNPCGLASRVVAGAGAGWVFVTPA